MYSVVYAGARMGFGQKSEKCVMPNSMGDASGLLKGFEGYCFL